MNDSASPALIAQRLRDILGPSRLADLEATALLLDVSEAALRSSIDLDDPRPIVEVIAGVVHVCGVDPGWIISGDYDPQRHRAVVGADEIPPEELALLIARRVMPPDVAPLSETNVQRLE